MRALTNLVLLSVVLWCGSACAERRTNTSGAGTGDPTLEESSGQQPTEEGMEESKDVKMIEGVLSPTVEAGGWVVSGEDGTFLLLDYQDYRQESWFREGARVRVWGTESPDTITIYMQGTPFKVEKMEPAEGQGSQSS